MRKSRALFATVLTMSALALSCRKDTPSTGKAEPADLSVSFSMPEIRLSTKSNGLFDSTDKISYGYKIITDPFSSDDSSWQSLEKYVDGRAVHRLTVFLINMVEHKLVAYRDFYKGSPDMKDASAPEGTNGWIDPHDDGEYASKITINFRYDHPMHGDSERLTRGDYQMIAIANHSAIDLTGVLEGTTHNIQHEGTKNIDGELWTPFLEGIIKEFEENREKGVVKSFKDYRNYWRAMRFTQAAPAPEFLCKLTPQPLILVKNISLNPGQNKVSGKLRKSRARVRVTVENISNYPLTISKFSFNDNFTKNKSYLLYNPDKPDELEQDPDERDSTKTPTAYGSPHVARHNDGVDSLWNALVTTALPATVGPLNGTGKDENNGIILFDGYVLDGNGKGKPFAYNMSFEYRGKTAKTLKMPGTSVAESQIDYGKFISMSQAGEIEDQLFAVQHQSNSKPFLEFGGNKLISKLITDYSAYESGYLDGSYNLTKPLPKLEPEQVFRFTPVRDATGNIKTVTLRDMTSNDKKPEFNGDKTVTCPIYTISSYDNQYVVLATKQGEATPLGSNLDTPEEYAVMVGHRTGDNHIGEEFIAFWSTTEEKYLNVYNPKDEYKVSSWFNNWGGSAFYLFKVSDEERPASFDGEVQISTIDPETAVVSPLKAIHCGDFINIHILVSYDDRAGDIKFTVVDWVERNSDDDIIFE